MIMPRPKSVHRLAAIVAGLTLLQAGCATWVKDTRVPPPAEAKHCEGSEVVTTTHVAALPIPIVAFFTPRITTNSPDSSEFLNRCGGRQQVNRRVEANYAVCVPTVFLSTIISLGIVGFCPKNVSWEADVVP